MSGGTRIRLMPMVMTAAAALLVLKVAGLATDMSYLFAPEAHAASPKAEAKPAEPALPDDHGVKEGAGEKPGAEGAKIEAARRADKVEPKPEPSPAERALLEALQKRREGVEARAADLDARENLLKAAEKRMDDRLGELKRLEAKIAEADARRAEEETSKLKELVVMYESMKVKAAAGIFDKLDPAVRLEVASRMKAQKLSDILGQMAPDSAQKLTVALARREVAAPSPATIAASDLPKIEGRPASR